MLVRAMEVAAIENFIFQVDCMGSMSRLFWFWFCEKKTSQVCWLDLLRSNFARLKKKIFTRALVSNRAGSRVQTREACSRKLRKNRSWGNVTRVNIPRFRPPKINKTKQTQQQHLVHWLSPLETHHDQIIGASIQDNFLPVDCFYWELHHQTNCIDIIVFSLRFEPTIHSYFFYITN